MWEAEYTNEFGAWYEALTEEEQDAVIARVELLQELGRASDGPPSTTSTNRGTAT